MGMKIRWADKNKLNEINAQTRMNCIYNRFEDSTDT